MLLGAAPSSFDGLAREPLRHGVRRSVSRSLDASASWACHARCAGDWGALDALTLKFVPIDFTEAAGDEYR